MAWLVAEVERLEQRMHRIALIRRRSSQPHAGRRLSALEDRLAHRIELHTETFYYVGFCFQDLLKKTFKYRALLEGIMIVRNKLIEHAEDLAGRSAQNFDAVPTFRRGPGPEARRRASAGQ